MKNRAEYVWDYTSVINIERLKECAEKEYYSDRSVEAKSFNNAVVLPYMPVPNSSKALGGVVDEDENYIEISKQHIVGKDVEGKYDFTSSKTEDKKIMWFGFYHNHWGHFLTEQVSRCWYLVDHSPEEEDFYVAYCLKKDTINKGMDGTFREFLSILGVSDERLLLVEEPTRFSEVIIPEQSAERCSWYTDKFLSIFDKMVSNVAYDTGNRKVYLTRSQTKNFANTQIGEKAIIKVFKKAGFEIVAPERISLREQIATMNSCDEIAIVLGSLTHNILFCKPGIKVTILNRNLGSDVYQPPISEAKNATITYVDCHLTFFPVVFAMGPFFFYFTDLFRKYCEDKGYEYKKFREGKFRTHIKLIWYFLMYLQNVTPDALDGWGADETISYDVMSRYKYFRAQLDDYDSNSERKIRNGFSKVFKKILSL